MTKVIDVNGELYIPLLNALNIHVDDKGVLQRPLPSGEGYKPCLIDGASIILPTSENLQNPPATEHVYFHPLCENIARGDSPVYNYIKLLVTLRINHVISGVADMLMHIAANKQLDGKLKSSQMELLKAVPKANEKTAANLVTGFLNMDLDKNVFYCVYNKRNGKVNNNTYNRVAVTRFPLLEQLNDIDKSPYWSAIKGLRKTDVQAFQSLFEYMIPNWNQENAYSGVSDSMEAPSFHALVSSFINVMTRLNELCNLYADLADFTTFATRDLHIIDQVIGNLARYNNVIPALPGNTGELADNTNSVNAVVTQPIGIPPVSLMDAADAKANAISIGQTPVIPNTVPMTTPAVPATQTTGTTELLPSQQVMKQMAANVNPMMMGMGMGMGGMNPMMTPQQMALIQQQQQQQAMQAALQQQQQQQAILAAQQQVAMQTAMQQQALLAQQNNASNPLASWNAQLAGMGMMNPQQQQQMAMMQQQQAMQAAMQQQMLGAGGYGGIKFNTI